jgi:hypothetical protein
MNLDVIPSLTTKATRRVERTELDAGGALGAYCYSEVRWLTIAASTIDPETQAETVAPDEIGKVRLERRWRFREIEHARMWAEVLRALAHEIADPHPIADLPHRCNGWVVEFSVPISETEVAVDA